MWTAFLTRGWELILLVYFTSGSRRWPKGQFSLRAGTMSLSVITQGSWGFHTLRRGIHQGKLLFRPEVVRVVEVKNMF